MYVTTVHTHSIYSTQLKYYNKHVFKCCGFKTKKENLEVLGNVLKYTILKKIIKGDKLYGTSYLLYIYMER